MIDYGDTGAVEHAGQLIRGDVWVAMNADLRIIRFCQPFENDRQRFVGIDKNSAHPNFSVC